MLPSPRKEDHHDIRNTAHIRNTTFPENIEALANDEIARVYETSLTTSHHEISDAWTSFENRSNLHKPNVLHIEEYHRNPGRLLDLFSVHIQEHLMMCNRDSPLPEFQVLLFPPFPQVPIQYSRLNAQHEHHHYSSSKRPSNHSQLCVKNKVWIV